MACNGMFGVGGGGMIQPPDPGRTFTLSTAEAGGAPAAAPQETIPTPSRFAELIYTRSVRDDLATELFHDLDTLRDMATTLPRDRCGRSPPGALATMAETGAAPFHRLRPAPYLACATQP